MTAEEKLKELYDLQNELPITQMNKDGSIAIHVTSSGGVYLSAAHIDLIANLVVERLKDAGKS